MIAWGWRGEFRAHAPRVDVSDESGRRSISKESIRSSLVANASLSSHPRSSLHGLESQHVVLVAVALGLLRACPDALREDAAKVLSTYSNRRLSFGAWLALLIDPAKLIDPTSTDPLASIVRAFVTGSGGPSALAKTLQRKVVSLRNGFMHGVVPSDPEGESVEPEFAVEWRRVREVLAPLRRATLFARAVIHDVAAAGDARCSVRVLHGPSVIFAVEERVPRMPVVEERCWLLREDGRTALPMEPLLYFDDKGKAPAIEVYVAHTVDAATRAKVEINASSSDEKRKLDRPW